MVTDGKDPAVQPRSVCTGCSSIIEPAALSKCVVHSCCSRPVCARCLDVSPRLATCCLLCEGAHHALRRGPRNDVTHAGQTLFDFDRIVQSAGTTDGTVPDGEAGGPSRPRSPPPAYPDAVKADLSSSKYVLGEDDESDEEGKDTSAQAPAWISSASRKQSAVSGRINADEAAKGLTASQNACDHPADEKSGNTNGLNSKNNASSLLRDALVDGRTSTSSSSHRDGASTALGARNNAQRPSPSSVQNPLSTNKATRQYWLRPHDSLASLSLRFGVNAGALCRLNDLPLSTATSSPHLIHTRQFLLIPESAIEKALASSSSHSSSSEARTVIESALQGPMPLGRAQKVHRARREAQSRFRALVAQNDRGRGASSSASADATLCDERAARAYIALMEDEMRFIDFGDEDPQDEKRPRKDGNVDRSDANSEVVADDEALIDAARQRRFDAILKQAVCRWEMDSDWERKQRAMGIQPESHPIPATSLPKASSSSLSNAAPSWLRWMNIDAVSAPPSEPKFSWREGWR